MNRRQQLLQGKRALVPRETIQFNTGDEMVAVEVRGLSAGARSDLMTSCVITSTDDDGETTQRTDLKKLQPALVIGCAYDPETGEPLFAEADRELLLATSAKYLDPIITAASRLSGLDDDVAQVAEKNSDRTGDNSSSGSSSPAN
jgi:hypothetical protein